MNTYYLSEYIIRQNKNRFNHLQLQKILYLFADKYFSTFCERPFFEEFVWTKYGPYLKSVYAIYAPWGALPLSPFNNSPNWEPKGEIKKMLDEIVNENLGLSGRALILKTFEKTLDRPLKV